MASCTSRVRFEVSITTGSVLRPHRPQFRHGDLKVGQQFQQERLERLIRAIQFIDQQHRRRQVRIDRRQQRPGLKELPRVDISRQLVAVGLPGSFSQADGHQLPGVVPLIGGRGQVHAIVALQAYQAALQARGEDLGDLGLAGAGLSFQKQRAAHGQRQCTVVASSRSAM